MGTVLQIVFVLLTQTLKTLGTQRYKIHILSQLNHLTVCHTFLPSLEQLSKSVPKLFTYKHAVS